jgi:membrane-associated progesterone receptor component
MIWSILLVILIVGGYFGYKYYTEQKEFEEYTKEYNLTLDELNEFNGIKKKRIFVCVKGDIFDVSSSSFYTPGGSYHIFAGKEASTSLAKGDLEGKYLNTLNHVLEEDEKVALEEWHTRFLEKYRKVGRIVQ